MEYNHNRPFEDFQEDLKIIRDKGFHPIACTQMYFEDVYVFETAHEANMAYDELEGLDGRIWAYWYAKDTFMKEVEDYESKEGASKILIYWL